VVIFKKVRLSNKILRLVWNHIQDFVDDILLTNGLRWCLRQKFKFILWSLFFFIPLDRKWSIEIKWVKKLYINEKKFNISLSEDILVYYFVIFYCIWFYIKFSLTCIQFIDNYLYICMSQKNVLSITFNAIWCKNVKNIHFWIGIGGVRIITKRKYDIPLDIINVR